MKAEGKRRAAGVKSMAFLLFMLPLVLRSRVTSINVRYRRLGRGRSLGQGRRRAGPARATTAP